MPIEHMFDRMRAWTIRPRLLNRAMSLVVAPLVLAAERRFRVVMAGSIKPCCWCLNCWWGRWVT